MWRRTVLALSVAVIVACVALMALDDPTSRPAGTPTITEAPR